MLTRQQIDNTLPLIEVGLVRYQALMNPITRPGYQDDPDFRRAFNGFYRMRRNKDFQGQFFPPFAVPGIDFRKALTRILEVTGRFEASFSTKLISTLDPGLPVIDQHVLRNVGLTLPGPRKHNRLEEIIRTYNELRHHCKKFISSPDGKYLVKQFDALYPFAKELQPMKKLDLVLWKLRN